jgi:hypothetical protein
MEIDKVGIDLGKSVFHLVGLSTTGETVLRKKFSRPPLLRFTANLRVRVIPVCRQATPNHSDLSSRQPTSSKCGQLPSGAVDVRHIDLSRRRSQRPRNVA